MVLKVLPSEGRATSQHLLKKEKGFVSPKDAQVKEQLTLIAY